MAHWRRNMVPPKAGIDGLSIRSASPDDAQALLAIYAPIVLNTAISFELSVPSATEFAGRIEQALAWLVAQCEGKIIGYAYATTLRAREAYRWSVETSAYVLEGARGQGVGAAIYWALIALLAAKGYCKAYAAIALPNDASEALHRKVGFDPVGVFACVGRKFGRWHDVSWWQLRIHDEPPPEPGES